MVLEGDLPRVWEEGPRIRGHTVVPTRRYGPKQCGILAPLPNPTALGLGRRWCPGAPQTTRGNHFSTSLWEIADPLSPKKKGTRLREGKPLWGTARLPFLAGLPFYSGCGCCFFYTGPLPAAINQGETSKQDPRASIFPPIYSRRRDLSRRLELLARAR